MRAQSLKNISSTTAIAAALIAGPNLVGFLADRFPSFLRRFLSGLYAVRPELLPVVVTPLVIVVVVYAFLSRGKRAGLGKEGTAPSSRWRQKLLPPLELVLLQIGNLTFAAFALILATLTVAFVLFVLRTLILDRPLLVQSFTASLALATLACLGALRPKVVKRQSWRNLRGAWTRRPASLALAIGGFGLVGATQGVGPLKLDLAASPLSIGSLTTLYLICLVCLLSSFLVARAGRSRALQDQSRQPARWFLPAFGLGWLATVGLLALYLHAALLTLRTQLTPG